MLVFLGLRVGFVGPLWAADPALMVEVESERRTALAIIDPAMRPATGHRPPMTALVRHFTRVLASQPTS